VKQPNDPGEITNEVTPIKVGDTLYLCTAHQRLFALDAASGKEKWHYDPELKTNESFQHVTCRGVSYHEAKAETASPEVMADCPRRIILPVNDGRLIAINAENGKLCETFANKGVLNLQSNMPDTKPGLYEPTSPPIITDKTIVMAGSVTDNFSTRETSGVIRGFDVNTGELLWAFDPGAKDPNAIPSDEHTFTFNSPNSWAPAAYDAKLDLVYLPMGVTTPDIWGGNRTPEVAIANPMALPFVSKLIPRGPGNPMEQPKDAKGTGTESGIQPQYGVPYGVTLNPFLSPFGLPCKQPAWGYISALDLKTNEVVWKKRIGTPQDSMPFPMPV
ncbi:TPA: PQQ-binding-like beta-propeller repeat protein, partial [Escherichia coli]|nr:PQQ-binding-like beta-propeller repeat protein [Escherichia coli]HCJ8622494.1 PQQ-binding-like beta-propeller repeat protein [Escherichia coli]HCJ9703719.1 PQQ-binding-like beta-propeller repeat protein [Escherichia coli]